MTDLSKFDPWIRDGGPAALVIREPLVPVEGSDGVFFPATYAAQLGAEKDKDKFQGGYNLDVFSDGSNVCLVDSVGSQANRIEPLFLIPEYSHLVPQIEVTFPEKGLKINLLIANHRAADALVRCSQFETPLKRAFQEILRGNSEPLAKIAPTSLVFGVWDSRDTFAKLPRLLTSTIRAFNIKVHTRSANFLTQMTIDLAKHDILPGADSKDGFANALASRVPGGIQLMSNGSIRRDATLGLAALRRLSVIEADGTLASDRTIALRRYILGLALVALTAPQESFLRQGCYLVPDIDNPRQLNIVNPDGSRPEAHISHEEAKGFARIAANAFGVGQSRSERFDVSLAEKAADGKPEKIKGVVLLVDSLAKSFKLKLIKGNEVDVTTTTATKFQKGKDDATFDAIVTPSATLDVSILKGIAVSVNAKK